MVRARRLLSTFRRVEILDGRNMEEIVKDAYGWLARTYQEGDQIYLFGRLAACSFVIVLAPDHCGIGFSRGAYQVRVLAGMIHEVCPELNMDYDVGLNTCTRSA